ncbi:MAG TPA: TlpA disulfide reductase family protein [Terriglobales bacterium]|nr:TlpA disulfide reductase family protein [Terriglobales bacterium]
MNRNTTVLMVVIFVVAGMLLTGHFLSKRASVAPVGTALGAADPSGKLAPDFRLKSIDGKSYRLADLRGKAVLLNFWATWCPPCKIEIPWFVELQKQYASQGLVIVGVAMDDDADKQKVVADFANEMKIDYPVLLGNDEVADEYGGVDALPTTFFIGRDGKIVRRFMGLAAHSDFEDAIHAALREGQSTQAYTAPLENVQGK